jgi:formylglycine-generating enzyme required for sulfatase activity
VFDPLSDPAGGVLVARGGSYRSLASRARSANRFPYSADYRENWLGVRPARRIAGEIQYDF